MPKKLQKGLLRWNKKDDHRGYVNNLVDSATGQHFNQPGHSLADLSVSVIEQVKTKKML